MPMINRKTKNKRQLDNKLSSKDYIRKGIFTTNINPDKINSTHPDKIHSPLTLKDKGKAKKPLTKNGIYRNNFK